PVCTGKSARPHHIAQRRSKHWPHDSLGPKRQRRSAKMPTQLASSQRRNREGKRGT
ncbi:hypothetical protein H4R22_002742, partial [Coemansia sp. RSA 1290]